MCMPGILCQFMVMGVFMVMIKMGFMPVQVFGFFLLTVNGNGNKGAGNAAFSGQFLFTLTPGIPRLFSSARKAS